MMSYIFSMIMMLTPSNGTQICWANSLKNSGEGTYSLGKSRLSVGILALSLCDVEFGDCEIEYCEQYKPVKKVR